MRRLRRSTCMRPRNDNAAGTARTRAAMLTRPTTAASGDQPAPISDRANVPEVPKVADESRARPSPTPADRSERIAPPVPVNSDLCNKQTSAMLMTLGGHLTGVKMVFAHDTEAALVSAAALVNTAGED